MTADEARKMTVTETDDAESVQLVLSAWYAAIALACAKGRWFVCEESVRPYKMTLTHRARREVFATLAAAGFEVHVEVKATRGGGTESVEVRW